MPTSPRFEDIIESSLDQLVATCESWRDPSATDIGVFYGRAILHFLRGEMELLQELSDRTREFFGTHEEVEHLAAAVAMRVCIRDRVFDGRLLKHSERIANDDSACALRWRGELLILLATSYTTFDNYSRALEYYVGAAEAFEAQGCRRKALRSRMNILVCESNLFPNRNLFARYHDLYRQALRSGQREMIVATTCLLNISREYQRAGAYQVALKYCNRALSLFELQMGEMNYFLTLAHRAHLLCELGRISEARLDFEAAQLGNFKEVTAALKFIEPLLRGEKPAEALGQDPAMIPTWRARAKEISTDAKPKAKLSALEERLVRLLAEGPRDRIDLLEEIYGTQLDHETKLNRFKSLLSALRKKTPGLILCEDGQYRLSDEILVPGLLSAPSSSAS